MFKVWNEVTKPVEVVHSQPYRQQKHFNDIILVSEAATRGVLWKKVFLEIL